VLTSALAVAAVFLPLAVAGPRLGYEIAHPLAVVLLGGLVTAVPLALFLLPALYLRFGTRPAPAERVAESPVPVDLHRGG
nr:efflux RND transporter permease subunit [Actinomycetota bacterium]